jgi:hypothetical protein
MAYIYCEHCCVGFHSNVRTCPECGRRVRRAYVAGRDRRFGRRGHTRAHALREDVESEVREEIYGWRSGSVEVGRSAARN